MNRPMKFFNLNHPNLNPTKLKPKHVNKEQVVLLKQGLKAKSLGGIKS